MLVGESAHRPSARDRLIDVHDHLRLLCSARLGPLRSRQYQYQSIHSMLIFLLAAALTQPVTVFERIAVDRGRPVPGGRGHGTHSAAPLVAVGRLRWRPRMQRHIRAFVARSCWACEEWPSRATELGSFPR